MTTALTLIGGPTVLIEIDGVKLVTDPTFDPPGGYPAGAITVRPIYLAVAATIDDVPDESGYVRRRMPFNEHSKAVRARYPELEPYITKALDRYMVLRAKGEAKPGAFERCLAPLPPVVHAVEQVVDPRVVLPQPGAVALVAT